MKNEQATLLKELNDYKDTLLLNKVEQLKDHVFRTKLKEMIGNHVRNLEQYSLKKEHKRALKMLQEKIDAHLFKVENDMMLKKFKQENARILKRLSDDADILVERDLNDKEMVVLGKLQKDWIASKKKCEEEIQRAKQRRIIEIENGSMRDTLKFQIIRELETMVQEEIQSANQNFDEEQTRVEDNVQGALMLLEVKKGCDNLLKEFTGKIEMLAKNISHEASKALMKDEVKKVEETLKENIEKVQKKRKIKGISAKSNAKVQTEIDELIKKFDGNVQIVVTEKLYKVVLNKQQTQQVLEPWRPWLFKGIALFGVEVVKCIIKQGV